MEEGRTEKSIDRYTKTFRDFRDSEFYIGGSYRILELTHSDTMTPLDAPGKQAF